MSGWSGLGKMHEDSSLPPLLRGTRQGDVVEAVGGSDRRRRPPEPYLAIGTTDRETYGSSHVSYKQRHEPTRKKISTTTTGHASSRHGSSVRRPLDPFAGRDLFPPFEEAFRIPSDFDDDHRGGNNNYNEDDDQDSDSISLNLSIGARAALHEHLRHVARFGIDGAEADAPAEVGCQSTARAYNGAGAAVAMDPLDAEWESLNRSTTTRHEEYDEDENDGDEGATNSRSTSFLVRHVGNDSSGSADDKQDDGGIGGAGEEAYEVLTDRSTDYFNSSRVKLLLTPEKNRNRPGPQVTTARGNRSYETSSGSESVLSSSLLLDDGQSVFGSDLANNDGDGLLDDNDDDGNNNDDLHFRSAHFNEFFFSDAEGGGVDVSFSAIHDVSRISALDVSHISADGSDAGQRSLHWFPPASGPAAASTASMPFAAALTPPRPALRGIVDSRATIDDELAKVVLYSSPQRLSSSRRVPSPRRTLDHPSRRAFLPPSHGGKSTGSHGDGSGSSGSHVTSEDGYGTHSRTDSAGYRADKEYSVSTTANDGHTRHPYVALSPTSTLASPEAESGGRPSLGRSKQDNAQSGSPFVKAGSFHVNSVEGQVDGTSVAREFDMAASPDAKRRGDGPQTPGLLSGRLTRTFSDHEHVEVVVMYDRTHNSIENDSDISSLHNHSSSYDKTSSGTSRSDFHADASAPSSAKSPLTMSDHSDPPSMMMMMMKQGSHPPAVPEPGGDAGTEDRRRYRTVVPTRVFVDLDVAAANEGDAMYPEPYDSFLSNPSSTATLERSRKVWMVREPGSHRSAPT